MSFSSVFISMDDLNGQLTIVSVLAILLQVVLLWYILPNPYTRLLISHSVTKRTDTMGLHVDNSVSTFGVPVGAGPSRDYLHWSCH